MRIATPQGVTERLCALVEDVARDHLHYHEPTDCFCGKGGFWRNGYDPVVADTWKHDDAAIVYIEQTVRARLAAEKRLRPLRQRLSLILQAVKP